MLAEPVFYCTNVHSQVHLSEWKDLMVKLSKGHTFTDGVRPLGLWFSEQLLSEIGVNMQEIAYFITDLNLSCVSLNAFPQMLFHQSTVKRAVYFPDWSEPSRLDYTKKCALMLSTFLKPSQKGSISTLPLGWSKDWNSDKQQAALMALIHISDFLSELEEKAGHSIRLCLEPEPGCVIETIQQAIDFWNILLDVAHTSEARARVQQHIGLCYDTCHQAVQWEDGATSLQQIYRAGVPIGKIQISLCPEWDSDPHKTTLEHRKSYCEERYLHQTRLKGWPKAKGFDDLSDALQYATLEDWTMPWRVHYHLPLFCTPLLKTQHRTTENDLVSTLNQAVRLFPNAHYEVETYTWNVLPINIRPKNIDELIVQIDREIAWANHVMEHHTLPPSTENQGMIS